ncbi:MAG: hypothetical protein JW829_04000 [Pirellulales bacterium]|nr:hypothetical protein [Pirellulales bacterium]
MASRKQTRIREGNGPLHWLKRVASELTGRGRLPLVVILLLALIGTGLYLGRHRIAPWIASMDQYRLDADRIHITPPPEWIAADVKVQVLRDGSLDQEISVLDGDLAKRLKDAFEMHPWIRSVDRVIKKTVPVGVEVAITYRQPVAAVVVNGKDGTLLLPIDADGVRLPNNGLQSDALRILPRILGATSQPPIGQAWREKPVLEGCRLAVYLAPMWARLNLVDIVPLNEETYRKKQFCTYELVTRGGTRIIWGAAPNAGPPGESSPDAKLARLQQFIDKHGPLTSVNSPAVIDLREGPIPKTIPRTAHHHQEADQNASPR